MERGEPAFAVWNNLCEHVAFVQQRQEGMMVRKTGGVWLIDSGLCCDTFNKIMVAPFSEESREWSAGAWDGGESVSQAHPTSWVQALRSSVTHFTKTERDFSVWSWDQSAEKTGTTGEPCLLQLTLERQGFEAVEHETGMSLRLADLASPEDMGLVPLAGKEAGGTGGNDRTALEAFTFGNFVLRPVRTDRELEAFAAVVADSWSPPDALVPRFYQQAAPLFLCEACPMSLWVAWAGDLPVACAEWFTGGGPGIGGLHMVCTRKMFRCQGLGWAVTRAALESGRQRRVSLAVLVASDQGQNIYSRMGFTVCGSLTEYALSV